MLFQIIISIILFLLLSGFMICMICLADHMDNPNSSTISKGSIITIIVLECILIGVLIWSNVTSYDSRMAYEAKQEYLSHVTGFVLEIPGGKTCNGRIETLNRRVRKHTYEHVQNIYCDDGTIYYNAMYSIRDTLWDNR